MRSPPAPVPYSASFSSSPSISVKAISIFAAWRVRAANGVALVYIYVPDEGTRKAIDYTGLTHAEAFAIAKAIVRLAGN